MQGPTAVGTTCLGPSWPVLGQVGAGIGSRKLPPFLVLPWMYRGSHSCGQPVPGSARPTKGRVLVVSWVMTRVRIWENIELSVGFRGCCEWL
jgi:hypothetical protein